jgi:hypothetical protein
MVQLVVAGMSVTIMVVVVEEESLLDIQRLIGSNATPYLKRKGE